MAKFKLTGNKIVAELKKEFNEAFGSKLKVFDKNKVAEDTVTLGELGLKEDQEFECRSSRTAGSFIAAFAEMGLKVKIYTQDEWVAVLNGLTLESTGKVKKNATKADMEGMEGYQREFDEKKQENQAFDKIVREIEMIEITGRATLYAAYEEDVDETIIEAIDNMDEEEREEIDYDWAEEATDGTIDDFLEDEYDGWSFDNEGLTVCVKYSDGTEETFEGVTLTEKEGETTENNNRLLRKSYSKYVVSDYIFDEPYELEGAFDIKKLAFTLNHYSVNKEEIITCAALSYDDEPLDFDSAPDGCDEKWVEYTIAYEEEVYTF